MDNAVAYQLVRQALAASEMALIYGGDTGFQHIGDDPNLNNGALWLVNRELTTRGKPCGFNVREGRVADFTSLEPGTEVEWLASLLPTGSGNGEMVVVRGPWRKGLTSEQADFVYAAAPALALLLDRYLNVTHAQWEQQQLTAFVDISRVISQADDLEAMLSRIAQMIATVTQIDYVSIDILAEDGTVKMRCLNFRQSVVDTHSERWKRGLNHRDPVRDEVLATRQPMLFADAQNDGRIPESGRAYFKRTLIRSTAVLPLVAKDASLGAISFASHRPVTFVEELPLLEGLASQVAAAVQGVRLYEERQRAQEAVQRGEELLRATLESTADGILVVDGNGRTSYFNRRFVDMWQIPSDVLDTQDDDRLVEFVLDQLEDPAAFRARVDALYGTTVESLETLTFKDGRVFERYSRPLMDQDGIRGRVWSFRDVTAERRAEAALRQSEERFRSLVLHASDLITVVDSETTVLYQSPSSKRVLGYQPDALVGTKLSELIHPEDVTHVLAFLGQAPDQRRKLAVEVRLLHRDGSWHAMEIVGADQRQDPAVRGFVLNIRDVSERKALESQLTHQAYHDPLTTLVNRTRFTDRLEDALERAKRNRSLLAVLFMDLDDFKSVNDGLGHAAGDRLLIEIANRIQACLRGNDTAARFGGDEFAILAEGLTDASDAEAVAERILQALEPPFETGGREVFLRASIGIALSDSGDGDGGRLMRNADVAMYAAKGRGKGRCAVHEASMDTSMLERLELLNALQRAVERREFVVHYQPTVRLDSGAVIGVEALVRWNHPGNGLLEPARFIALAEESGVILPLGRWVLNEACGQMKRWQALYPAEPPLTIGVNVSVRQMQEPGFAEEVARALAESRLTPAHLVLEITESVMLQDAEMMVSVLRQLKEIGVQLAIDDFGTGYSSLNYLRQFPFDILKIDRAFVDHEQQANHKDVTRAIIELGRTLHMEIVAEGVESAEQAARLFALGCEVGQGYHFAKPLPAAQLEQLLRNAAQKRAA